ncbi:MAG: nucleotidyltransferase domain-containing protein [bacterium]
MSKLIKRARLAGRILRFVPFLRMAALNGSIVRGVENKQSDIDILIIARAGRLYTCRAFATALIQLTGYRRHGQKIAGRICLNCYLNDKNPNIFPQRKSSAPKVARAYKYLIPLVDDGISKKFFKVNKWFGKYQVRGEKHSQLLKRHCFAKFPLRLLSSLRAKLLSSRALSRHSEPVWGRNPNLVKCEESLAYARSSTLSSRPRMLSSPPSSRPSPRRVEGSKPRLPRSFQLLAMTNLLELFLSGKFGNYVENKLMNYQIKRIFSFPDPKGELIATRDEIRLHPRKNTKLSIDTKYIF